MTDKRAKSLRWLANQFPAVETPKDDTDRISTCIHLYCTAGADTIDTLIAQLAALQAENAELQRDAEQEHERYIETMGERDGFEARATVLGAALARVEAELDAAISDVPHDCEHCKCAEVNGACKLLPDGDEFSPDYTDGFDRDGNCDHWEWRGAQGEGQDGD